jgi:hypothetical protein
MSRRLVVLSCAAWVCALAQPLDAQIHPRDLEAKQEQIDVGIRPVVLLINRSGWVWARSSQSSDGWAPGDRRWNVELGLITNDPGRLMRLFFDALLEVGSDPDQGHNPQEPDLMAPTVALYSPAAIRRHVASLGKYHIQINFRGQAEPDRLRALAIFEALARRVTER